MYGLSVIMYESFQPQENALNQLRKKKTTALYDTIY